MNPLHEDAEISAESIFIHRNEIDEAGRSSIPFPVIARVLVNAAAPTTLACFIDLAVSNLGRPEFSIDRERGIDADLSIPHLIATSL